MQNNNTSDIAYLGCYENDSIDIGIDSEVLQYVNCPQWVGYKIDDVMLFDCNGTRYGFRIKKYKK